MKTLAIITIMFLLSFNGCIPDEKNRVENGCCQVGQGCADGPNVTQEACYKVLNGEWVEGTICNIETGICE